MPHQSILNKIYDSIYSHIDQIIIHQTENNGELEQKSALLLIEYAKFLRTDKGNPEDELDLSKLSAEELDEMIKEELKKAKK